MSTEKTIDISKLSEAQQSLLTGLFEQFCERSEPKEEISPCGLKNGDTYYFITDDGHISIAKWQNRASDFKRLALGNVFKTEEDTKFAIEKQKVKVELEQYAKEHNDPEGDEWNGENDHYDIGYNVLDKILTTIPTYVIRGNNDIPFTSAQIAREAIDKVGTKRIMKYLFDVDCEVDE